MSESGAVSIEERSALDRLERVADRLSGQLAGDELAGAWPALQHSLAPPRAAEPRRGGSGRHRPRAGSVVVVACALAVAVALPLAVALSSGTRSTGRQQRQAGALGHPAIGSTGGPGPCAGLPPGCGTPAGGAAALAAGRWERFPSGPLSPRIGETEVWTGRELLVWGGEPMGKQLGVALADGAAYDPRDGRWRKLPASPLQARTGASGVWTGSEMVVLGGNAGGGATALLPTVAAYRPSSGAWVRLPSMPALLTTPKPPHSPVFGPPLTLFTGRDVVVMTAASLLSHEHAGAALDPVAKRWALLPPLPSTGSAAKGWQLAAADAVWTGREVVVLLTWQHTRTYRGGTGFAVSGVSAVYAWHEGAARWSTVHLLASDGFVSVPASTNLPVNFGSGGEAVWTGRDVLVLGGRWCPVSCPTSQAINAALDLSSGRASAVRALSATDIYPWPAVWTGRAAIDAGSGWALSNPPKDASATMLVAFDPATGRVAWLPRVPRSLSFAARSPGVGRGISPPPAVWAGDRLLVWGVHSFELVPGSS